jgi:hypothetical protein
VTRSCRTRLGASARGAAAGLLLAALAGCRDGDSIVGPKPVEFRWLGETSYSCRSSPGWTLARTQEELERAWGEFACDGAGTEAPELPVGEMALVYFMGEYPSGGYAAGVEKVVRVGGEIRVAIVEWHPGSGCPVTRAFTRPAVAAAITRVPGTVRVDVRTETAPCK